MPSHSLDSLDSILFDLDGTLWDVTSLAANARNDVMKRMEIQHRPFTREDIAKYIGLPVDEIYEKLFPNWAPEERFRLRKAVSEEIATRLPTIGADIYPGVAEGLALLNRKYRLFIVSNCAQGYIENFLNYSKFSPLISDHECYGRTLKPKGENIRSVVERNHLKFPLYVGDTDGDHKAALEAQVPYAHVDYGFGEPLGPCPRFSSFSDLVQALLK